MITTTNACINCENLIANLNCAKHEQPVQLDNSCTDHSYRKAISKDSSCRNCTKNNTPQCPNPALAAHGMLCFSWS